MWMNVAKPVFDMFNTTVTGFHLRISIVDSYRRYEYMLFTAHVTCMHYSYPVLSYPGLSIPDNFKYIIIGRDLSAAKSYLLSDGQNMYSRVVLVCTVNLIHTR